MKRITALICAACLLAGCGPADSSAEVPEENEEQQAAVQEAQDQGNDETASEDGEEETGSAETADYQELFEIKAGGIDYLSVDGIQLPAAVRIAMVGKDSGSGFWNQVEEGAGQAVEDLNAALGYTGSEKIELIYDASKEGDVAEQIEIIDQMLDKSPDALVIGFVDVNSSRTQLELAESNGIPVFSVDSGIEDSLIVSTVQTDNYQAGVEAAKQLAVLMGDSGQAALLVHSSETETGIERERGFTDEMKQNHPDIEIVNISYRDQDERSVDDIVAAVLAEYPELEAYQAMNEETTEELVSALQMYGPEDREIITTGFDLSEKEAEELEEGTLAGVIAQNPYGMGYASAVSALRAAARLDNASIVDTGYYWITAENIQEPKNQLLLYK